MTTSAYRLPKHIRPTAYRIDLAASPKRSKFEGLVEIDLTIDTPSTEIILHARDMSLDEVHCIRGKKKETLSFRANDEDETVVLELPKAMKGRCSLSIAYRGALNPSMHGLYLAKDGRERAICSQCEATDARAIFPCFDEPEFKATLQWTVRTDPGLMVITNGVLKDKNTRSASKKSGTKTTVWRFKPTRVISTYLAAITIGEYEAAPAKKINGIPHRVWSGVGKVEQTEFSQAVTEFVLPWYREYFAQPYNYQKLDQVAVPGFDAGAMENVGAIFYRQALLLMNSEDASFGAKKRIAEVVAHELAHQWFGNLVTMEWWDDLWLNEAFATWIAFKVIDEWRPEWRMWDDYLVGKEMALRADGLKSTHPVYTDVRTPAQATELFDVITYEKGCAVLRMAEEFVGAEAFRAGLQDYMATFKNKNARGDDLWNALQSASGQPLAEVMKCWVTQSGFPKIRIEPRFSMGNTILKVSQSRFHSDPKENKASDSVLWSIPMVIEYGTEGGIHQKRVVLREECEEVVLEGEALWVSGNQDASGFYRVTYSGPWLTRLLRGLFELSPASRVSLLNDAWAFLMSGDIDADTFMDVLAAFRDERDFIVMQAVSSRISALSEFLVTDTARARFEVFVGRMLSDQFFELGFEPRPYEPTEYRVRRAAVLSALSKAGRDELVISGLCARAKEELASPGHVDAEIAGVTLSTAAMVGGKKELEQFFKSYAKAKQQKASPQILGRYLSALSYFENKAAIHKVLAATLDGAIPQEQIRAVIQPMLSHRSTQEVTWVWLKKNWKRIGPRVGLMGLARLVEATGALPSVYKKDIQEFFKKHRVAEAERAVKKALEAMGLRVALQRREQKNVARWLKANVSS